MPNEAEPAHAHAAYIKAVNKGLLKIMSKMGISTLQSYCGAQTFEAVGLSHDLVQRHFSGTSSRLGGVDLDVIADETLRRHAHAYGCRRRVGSRRGATTTIEFRVRALWNRARSLPFSTATRSARYDTFKEFSRLADAESRNGSTIRGLLDFTGRDPVRLCEVEAASELVRRFVTGAMSFGSLSREAHETIAIAMNRLGGRSNTGEGGEDPERFGTERSSAIKQVASARSRSPTSTSSTPLSSRSRSRRAQARRRRTAPRP